MSEQTMTHPVENRMGPTGPKGPKGEPGPFGARTELELLQHLISELENDALHSQTIYREDGVNHRKTVDGWALQQAIDALKNYQALLRQPLYELIPPGFYHVSRPANGVEGVR